MRRFLRKVLSFLGRFKVQNLLAGRNIQLIRSSSLFDSDYYCENNPDVMVNGSDPAEHYYYCGWKDGRDPSAEFNNNFYMEYNHVNKNPLVHYLLTGKKNPKIRISSDSKSVSDLSAKYFGLCKPFRTLPLSSSKSRLNLVFNRFDLRRFSSGHAVALMLAVRYANACRCSLRIISQDTDAEIFKRFLKLFSLDKPQTVEYFSIKSGARLEISENDDFLCTAWNVADAVLHTPCITGKIFYIMQNDETLLLNHGDQHLRCYNTLTDPRLIPVVNSRLLYDYLIEHGYENVRDRGICFEPAFSKELLKSDEASVAEKKKYTLFYYARPTCETNLFYFGLQCLNEAFLSDRLDPKQWIVYIVDDKTVPDFNFDTKDVEIKKTGILNWDKYRAFLSGVDLCFSMSYTPHPGYQILNAVTAGAVSVTNRFLNKQDLRRYSDNIITAQLKEDAILDALEAGAALAMDSERRAHNYRSSRIAGNWEETLALVIEHMQKNI